MSRQAALYALGSIGNNKPIWMKEDTGSKRYFMLCGVWREKCPEGKSLESKLDEQTKMVVTKGVIQWIVFLAVRKEDKMQM